ncbi:MAG: hypothetical protein IKB82_01955 [Clostridia bacterium]|nr:hypothetical protein [Clostridia bacterium]
MKEGLLIGIDGGGTHSTAVAARQDGQVVAIAHEDGLNYHNIGVEPVLRRMENMARALCASAGSPFDAVCVGMSALDAPADDATLSLFTGGFFSREQLDLQSDAYIALMGFTRGDPGMIVICGTGSMLLLSDHSGAQHVSGGWGYLLGDAGSGYTLAREGIIAAIDAQEGLASPTALAAHACAYFDVPSLRQIIDRVYAPGFTPDRLAGFARHVLAEAARGDDAANGILHRNMQRLARQAASLMHASSGTRRIGLYGGIFAHSPLARALFSDTLLALCPQAEICSLEYPPELGAIIHLMKQRGTLNEESLLRLKQSYEELRGNAR